MFDVIIPVLLEVLGVVGVVLLVIIGVIGIAAARIGLKKLGINMDDIAYNEIITIITNIIKALYQKYTKTIKDNSEDGKLTEYQANMIRKKAITIIKAMLSADQIDVLLVKYNMTDIDEVLDIVTHAVLLDVKNEVKDDMTIQTSDIDYGYDGNETEVASICYAEPTEEELESIALCDADCSVCPLRDECLICRLGMEPVEEVLD